MSQLELRDIRKTYPGALDETLKGINIDIASGEFLTLVGPSGCGKSTLMNSIAGLESITGGSIVVEGKDISNMEPKDRDIAMVFQSYALYPTMSVRENIAFGLKIRGMPKDEIQQEVERVADLLQISALLDKKPARLSGGQQQRVGIARSLAVEPDIWFLDEPFSALDPLIRKEMQDEFMRLQGVLNKTILFVTHDFDEALRLADRIAIMKEGVIEQLDTPANIVLNPATEYVRKFTEEVPREKVLKIESVMDPVDSSEELSDLKVSKDAIIETVAEAVLSERKPVAVVDANNKVVGAVHSSKVIHVLFGSRTEKENKD